MGSRWQWQDQCPRRIWNLLRRSSRARQSSPERDRTALLGGLSTLLQHLHTTRQSDDELRIPFGSVRFYGKFEPVSIKRPAAPGAVELPESGFLADRAGQRVHLSAHAHSVHLSIQPQFAEATWRNSR